MSESLTGLAARLHANSRAWFPQVHDVTWSTVMHAALGLGGETGEVLDIIKKADICGLTDHCTMHADGKHSHAALEAELADVLTYLLVLAHELGIDMEAAVEAKQAVCVERWGDPNVAMGGSGDEAIRVLRSEPADDTVQVPRAEWDALVDAIDDDGGTVANYRARVTGAAARLVREVRSAPGAGR